MFGWINKNISMISVFVDIIAGIVIPILIQTEVNNLYLYIIVVLLIVFNVTTLLILKRKNSNLKLYETVLSQNVPLYGIAKYLARKSQEKKNDYTNNVQISHLELSVKLVGKIDANQNNTLEFWWRIKGGNKNKENVDNFNMRIGGDNSLDTNDLKLEVYECQSCKNNNCKHKCMLNNSEKHKQKLTVNYILAQHTYRHIQFDFRKPLHTNEMFDVCIRYIWPNCYNSICDFLLIDPNNFSESIRSISTEICCDNIVIKESSTVKLYKLNIETTSSELVTTIPYDGSHNNFKYEFCAEETCLYYIIIENN